MAGRREGVWKRTNLAGGRGRQVEEAEEGGHRIAQPICVCF